LRAGEIDVDAYVEHKVDESTAHLSGMPAAGLKEIRSALRQRLYSDPMLADLVRTATGQASPPPRDE
jgi:hypothetical protein